MGLRICSLASGSKGNSIFVADGRTKILIDNGLPLSMLADRLAAIGESVAGLDAVVVTHEHGDHVRGIAALASEADIMVYAHERTFEAMLDVMQIELKNQFHFTREFSIGTLDIMPFALSHDAVRHLGYTVSGDGGKITVATDLGIVTDNLYQEAQGSDIVFIESNHDREMLLNGAYPHFLKRRIMSGSGHLSNAECAECIAKIAQSGTKRFVLGHLSEENNLPELAYYTVSKALAEQGAGGIKIAVAGQRKPSVVFDTANSV
jgi:phosphoribosyl 1,2-cyclic phosphodiesterase